MAAQTSSQELAKQFSFEPTQLEESIRAEKGPSKLIHGLVLADVYGKTHPDKALQQLDTLTAEIEITDDVDLRAYALAVRCSALIRHGEIDRATKYCEEARLFVEHVGNVFVKTRVLSTLNFYRVRQGKLKEALESAMRAERLAEQIGDPVLEASTLNASALTFEFSGLHAQAVDRFQSARGKLRAYPDEALSKMISFNLGLAYREIGELDRALALFREGYAWAETTGLRHRTFIGQIEIANTLIRLDRAEEVAEILSSAVSDESAVDDPDSLMHAMLVLGRAELAIKNPEVALTYFGRGLASAQRTENLRRSGQLRLAIVESLNALNRPDEALDMVDALIADLKKRAPTDELDEALADRGKLHAAAGDYAQAYRDIVEAEQLAREARAGFFERKLALMEVAQQIEEANRQKELALARSRNLTAQVDRSRLLGLGGFLLFILALAAIYFDRRSRLKQRQIVEHERNSAALEALVAQRTRALEEQMTERMRGEEDRHKLEQELAESEKLRSLGQLTGGVAHDFNNLLTVIIGAAELLEEEPELPVSERRGLIQAIQEAAKSGSEINMGLLAYVRKQRLNPELVDLEEFCDNAKTLLQQTLGEGMALSMDVASLTILVDRGQLTTTMINLLTNAREASDSHGDVRIEVVEARRDGSRFAQITVRDSGCGMTEQAVAKATEPFYSTKNATIATGLGLSRVYGFVQQSGGDFEIESALNFGTSVTLSFPSVDAVRTEAHPRTSAVIATQNILLVDDNEDVREMVKRMLVALGHSVSIAQNAEHALELMNETEPGILITDVLMPGPMGGVELANMARQKFSELPILMISGFAVADSLNFPLLSKPFSLSELEQSLNTLLKN